MLFALSTPRRKVHRSPPQTLSMVDTFRDLSGCLKPQVVPNPIWTVSFYTYIPMITFNIKIRHGKRLRITSNKIEKLKYTIIKVMWMFSLSLLSLSPPLSDFHIFLSESIPIYSPYLCNPLSLAANSSLSLISGGPLLMSSVGSVLSAATHAINWNVFSVHVFPPQI